MSTAEDLINQASNRLVDYSGNAASAANAAIAEAYQLKDVIRVLLPDWNGGAVARPGTIDLGEAPAQFTEGYSDPGSPGEAPDIAALMLAAFESADAPSRAMVDSAMYSFTAQYCPEYFTQLSSLVTYLNGGAEGGSPVIDAQYDAMMADLANAIDNERRAEQRKIGRDSARGHETGLFMTARLDMAEQAANDRLAAGRASLISHIVDLAVDYRKHCLSLTQSLVQDSRSVFLNYAGIVANLRQFMLQYADSAANAALKGYEAELQQFDGQRKAALAVLEAAIERAKGQVDVYKAQIEARAEAKRFEYDAVRVTLDQLRIPYDGELRVNLAQAGFDMEARKAAIAALDEMAKVYGGISESLASGINAIASQSLEE